MKKTDSLKKGIRDIIEDYKIDICRKDREYSRKEKEIVSELIENDSLQLRNIDACLEYLELASNVQKDFSKMEDIIKENLARLSYKQIEILKLILRWSEKKKQYYKYYSDFLADGNNEYAKKSAELKQEAEILKKNFLEWISKD